MALARTAEWRKLPLSLGELCIDTTLRCGQSFRWRKINDEWNCALHGRVLSLRQDATHLHFRVTWPTQKTEPLTPPPSATASVNGSPATLDDTEALLKHYLSLKLDLVSMYEQWSLADANFKRRAPKFEGVRILSQDAWETLICFICSSNNNISRITQMVHKLCLYYGPLIGHVGGEAFHDFPPPQALTGTKVESHLRELGFGYRAKYIAQTARIVANEKPKGWLDSLTNPVNPNFRSASGGDAVPPVTYKEAHEQLLQLTGVGPKVADCVCLMGLGWGEAVPVDTHVWQIAQRDYKFGRGKAGKTATLSKALYDAVGDHFRGLWGEYAGWAHSVLFTADLKAFADKGTEASATGKTPAATATRVVVKTELEPDVQTLSKGIKRESTKVKIEVTTDELGEAGPSPKRRRTRSQAAVVR